MPLQLCWFRRSVWQVITIYFTQQVIDFLNVYRLISCRAISHKTKAGLARTMQERLRIPWKGGAKQIAFDALLPVFIIPIMLLIGAISLWWTIFSFTTVAIFLMLIYKFFIHTIPTTKFFFMWTATTLVVLYLIFQVNIFLFFFQQYKLQIWEFFSLKIFLYS